MSDEEIIDISIPITEGMPQWPTQKKVSVRRISSMEEGAAHTESELSNLNMHVGTHIDAPLHFVKGGAPTESIPLSKMNGPVEVIEIRGTDRIRAEDLQSAVHHPDGTRILLKTDNSERWSGKGYQQPFDEQYVAIDATAAAWLADRKTDLVGIDYLSIQKYHDAIDTHQILLNANIVILEGLDLHHVSPGQYKLLCLPLKIGGVEGAPARAVLKPLSG